MKTTRTSITTSSISAMALVLALSACGEDTPNDEQGPTEEVETETPQSEEPDPEEETSQDTDTDGDSAEESGNGGEASGSTTTPRGADLATTEFAVVWTDAVNSAMENFEGQVEEVELEWDRDRYAYKVELVSDTEKYIARIDADSGEQYDDRTEQLDAEDIAEKENEVFDIESVVPVEEALASALEAQAGTVVEWVLEGTNRGPEYEFNIETEDGQDYDVTVDATNGEVIEVDD